MLLVLKLHGNSVPQSFLVLNSTTTIQIIKIVMASIIAMVLIHLIVAVSLTGIVSHGQIHQEKEDLNGNSKQSCGILTVPCPKLVRLIPRFVFSLNLSGHLSQTVIYTKVYFSG